VFEKKNKPILSQYPEDSAFCCLTTMRFRMILDVVQRLSGGGGVTQTRQASLGQATIRSGFAGSISDRLAAREFFYRMVPLSHTSFCRLG
jgi:hypothetical protein